MGLKDKIKNTRQTRNEMGGRYKEAGRNGPEQRGTGTNGRNTIIFKNGSISAGVKSEVKHCIK